MESLQLLLVSPRRPPNISNHTKRCKYLVQQGQVGLGSHEGLHHLDVSPVGGAVQRGVPILRMETWMSRIGE